MIHRHAALRGPHLWRGALAAVATLALSLHAAACAAPRPHTSTAADAARPSQTDTAADLGRPSHTDAAADAALREAPVRAMTFNIRYGTAPDGANEWSRRRHLAFHVIRDHGPHVLGLQEALRFQLDELRSEFPHLLELGVGRDDGDRQGEYSAILYDGGRLEPLEEGTFWLSDTPEVPGSMTWGNRYPRVVTWAHFRDLAAGGSFFVYNTHWDHEAQAARESGARLMLDRIAARAVADPLLVMGDFNAGEDNPAFTLLLADTQAVRLYDTFRALRPHAQDVGTYHAFTGDRSGPRIDAILASPEWRTLDAAIVRVAQEGVYPSDHFPVIATVVRR